MEHFELEWALMLTFPFLAFYGQVDVLNAKTKTFYAGDTIPMEFQEGTVFANIRMPENAAEPFLWKVLLLPNWVAQ